MGQENNYTKVTCRVCQEMIDIIFKKDQHVVKCNRCNEATVSIFVIKMIYLIVYLKINIIFCVYYYYLFA